MPDGAISSHPAVQEQLDRLAALGMGGDVLGLDRVSALCERIGNPQCDLPPVFHVAGTNGKGSTVAVLRAALEAGGSTVHAFTSPHLVRFNERIRVAGQLIQDEALAPLLEEVIDAAKGMKISFFEVTTAAAFLAFSRTPAEATLVEVGLGGRLDATNIVKPVTTGIAALGMDHAQFLGDDIARIAFEKAGIAKRGVPLVTQSQPARAMKAISQHCRDIGAPLMRQDAEWSIEVAGEIAAYRDGYGSKRLPTPALRGAHQVDNLGLAAAMLRSQDTVTRYDLAGGATGARWPARIQRLGAGPLTQGIDAPVIIDGAHNPEAARALAAAMGDGPIVMLCGILKNRDHAAILRAFEGRVTRFAGLPVVGHDDHDTKDLCAEANAIFGLAGSYPCGDVGQAFDWLRRDPPAPGERVLVMGSLYLAGEVLRRNGESPA